MNKIWEKIASGRFIFTVITAWVFFIMALKGGMPADKVAEIIMMVIIFYFSRTDRSNTQGGSNV